MHKSSKIFVAGASGMVGSACIKQLSLGGYSNVISSGRQELNLLNKQDVFTFFSDVQPQIVILAAAKVGGIQANIENPATFLFDNLMIQNNVIDAAYQHGTEKLLFLGSSCIYPKDCAQPMKEDYLLTGKLEPTNEGYAIAKIAGIKLLEGYRKQYGFKSISLMPCNLYGPNDSFDLKHSHVLSALVKRFSDAVKEEKQEITLWGSGIARREFMHVIDCARAVLYMLENYHDDNFINVGTGTDISIRELAEMIACLTGFKGIVNWDISKPDGMLKKCMDVSKMKALGFNPEIKLKDGVKQMIQIYKDLKSYS